MPSGLVSAYGHCLDVAANRSRLVNPVLLPLNSHGSWSQQFPTGLFEREALILAACTKRRRALDLSLEEGIPGAIQPVCNRLNGLGIYQLPVWKPRAP